MFLRVLFVLALPCASAQSLADQPDQTLVHDLTVQGIDRLYNLEIDGARAIFDSVSAMAPADPRGPFFRSVLHFYLFGLNRDDQELAAFLTSSDNVIAICEALLDRNNKDATVKFYLGGIYGYRGLAYHGSGSYFKAARDGRKGYLLLEEALTEKPDLYDAHMGFGLFQYLLAKIPSSMRWIVTMLGFSGDEETGLRSLRYAAERGTYTRAEAKLYLAQFLFSRGERDTALRYLAELRGRYPENTLFTVLYASWQHRMDNLEEAMQAAIVAIELNNRKSIRHGEELAYSTLGSIYFTKNDFPNAAANYRLYLQATTNEARLPNYTLYRAGVACEIAGDRTTAMEFYRRMRSDSRGGRGDAQHFRRGQELLRHPISEAGVLIVKAGNELSQKNYELAIGMFREALLHAGDNVDLQARALYGLQQAEFDAEQPAAAEETSRRLLALKPVNEGWIIPHAWFRLGQIHAKSGRRVEATKAFEIVNRFDDYEFEDRLRRRVEEEIKNLR